MLNIEHLHIGDFLQACIALQIGQVASRVARFTKSGCNIALANIKRPDVSEFIQPHEIRIVARTVATDEGISLTLCQQAKRLKRGTPVQVGIVCAAALKSGIVRNGHRILMAERAVVFGHNDHGVYRLDTLPHPVIIAVDINA